MYGGNSIGAPPPLLFSGTSGASDGYVLSLRDNGMPVRFDLIVAWFFLLSAIFHSFPVVFGPFDRFAWAYWKCIDSAFCYWRCAPCITQPCYQPRAEHMVSPLRAGGSSIPPRHPSW